MELDYALLADAAQIQQDSLVEALEVAAAASVRLALDEPWAVDDQTGLTGTTGEIELVKSWRGAARAGARRRGRSSGRLGNLPGRV